MEYNLQKTSNNYHLNNLNILNDNYCSNCGNYGHLFKHCNEPVNSYGLLCLFAV